MNRRILLQIQRTLFLSAILFLGSPPLFADIVKNICNRFRTPGSCAVHVPIALVVYDPFAFFDFPRNRFTKARELVFYPGDSDCLVVQRHLENNGYCIEGLGLSHSQALVDAVKTKPALLNRYTYIVNIGHGQPGRWVSKSKCEFAAIQTCLRQQSFYSFESFLACIQKEQALPHPTCPCYGEESAAAPRSAGPVQKQLQEKLEACKKLHEEDYTTDQNLEMVGSIAKSPAIIFANSCLTAKEPEAAAIFGSRLCKKAPEGTKFNMARTQTGGALIHDGISYRRKIFWQLASELQSRNFDFNKNGPIIYELQTGNPLEPAVEFLPMGSFACFQCQSQQAFEIPCSVFPFPDGVQNVPIEQIPEQRR